MKCVILAGGRGSRIAEESLTRPKPMVEVGGRPILWHIMKIYGEHSVRDFVVCLGYKGYMIKEYFANYFLHNADVTINLETNNVDFHVTRSERWSITLVDTGETTQTGGRLKRVSEYLPKEEPFCMTYGDGLGDVDVSSLVAFHRQHGRRATMTVVSATPRWGGVQVQDQQVVSFHEKRHDGSLINGGFFVLKPDVLDLIDDDTTAWEQGPLEELSARGQLAAWHHNGFWQAMDTLRERDQLEAMWSVGSAPWKVWT